MHVCMTVNFWNCMASSVARGPLRVPKIIGSITGRVILKTYKKMVPVNTHACVTAKQGQYMC